MEKMKVEWDRLKQFMSLLESSKSKAMDLFDSMNQATRQLAAEHLGMVE